nr:unnamed protein product [Callosobruchus chinensis]
MKSYLIALTYKTQKKEENIEIKFQKTEVSSKRQFRKEAGQNRGTRTLRVSRVAQNHFQHFTLKGITFSANEEVENMELEAQEVASQNEGTWSQPVGNHKVFDYSAESGIHAGYAATLINDLFPYSCFRSIVDDKIIEELVNQTNLYATQVSSDSEDISKQSRLHRWVPTDKEMFKFIGIVAYMGMVRMPSLENYWSNDELFHISIIPKIMQRNRFQLLLRLWHFSDNKDCPEGDRLHKIKPLSDALVNNFQTIYTPGGRFCIDESVVPFQGRLLIKQYIDTKQNT